MTDLVKGIPGHGELSPAVREYVRDAVSENTKRAYLSDLKHFTAWGGTIPATDVVVTDFLLNRLANGS